MKEFVQVSLIAIILMAGLTSCGSMSHESRDTAIGAGLGGAAGAAVTGSGMGTAAGAVAGGVIGHEIGEKK